MIYRVRNFCPEFYIDKNGDEVHPWYCGGMLTKSRDYILFKVYKTYWLLDYHKTHKKVLKSIEIKPFWK
jgi:hypothetical protein